MTHHGIDFPRDELARLCERHGIRRLALFGSILRPDFDAQSDIDVLVEFQPGTRVGLRYFQIEQELSELLGRQVDLNTPGFLSADFRDDVTTTAEVQYDATG